MKILLDTHVWIWAQESPERLGGVAQGLLADEDNTLLVSPISTLEIARLPSSGRITLAGRLQTWISESQNALMADTAPLTHEVAVAAYELPADFHADPADRMLVATGMVGDLPLMTADERILAYPHVLSIDARA